MASSSSKSIKQENPLTNTSSPKRMKQIVDVPDVVGSPPVRTTTYDQLTKISLGSPPLSVHTPKKQQPQSQLTNFGPKPAKPHFYEYDQHEAREKYSTTPEQPPSSPAFEDYVPKIEEERERRLVRRVKIADELEKTR